jgi:hypothetical protein
MKINSSDHTAQYSRDIGLLKTRMSVFNTEILAKKLSSMSKE